MKRIAVLMSTYNGEKYLREQIDSILSQKDVSVELFIRDDGSSDSTVEIVKDYINKNNNIYLECGNNVGVGNSFMNLLYSAPDNFDYYAFSDQDDIWNEYKLYEAIKLLEESGKLLYVSNQECIDKDGFSLGMHWETNDKRINFDAIGIVCRNVLCGCTMLLNYELYSLLIQEKRRPPQSVLFVKNHDGWIAAVAALYDGIIYDERSFMKYRQHSGNVVGAYERKLKFSRKLKIRIKKLFNSELRNYRSNTARALCEKFPEQTDNQPMLNICANSKTIKGKRKILDHSVFFRSFTGEGKFTFYMKVLFGLF